MTLLYLLLVSLGFTVIQCLLGGTRLLFAIPTYAIFAVAAVLSAISIRRATSRPALTALIPTFLLAGYVILRAALSQNEYLARPDLYMAAGCLIVYLLTTFCITETRSRIWIIVTFFAIAVAELGVGVVQFADNPTFMLFGFARQADYLRASGMFISGNHFAGYLETVALLAISFCVWGRWPIVPRSIAGYLAILCYVGVATSGSRGGYISSTFSLLVLAGMSIWVMGLVDPTKRYRTMLIIGTVLFIGLAGAGKLMLSSPLISQRLGLIGAKDVRSYNWQAALDQFKLSPLTGTGSGTHLIYGRLFRRVPLQTDPVHAHGDYLELLAEYGIIGEILALLFLTTHLVNGVRAVHRISVHRLRHSNGKGRSDSLALALGSIAAVAALISHSVVDFNMHIPGNALVLSFIFAVLANPGVDRPAEFPGWLSLTALLRLGLVALGAGTLAMVIPKFKGEQLSEQARVALRDKEFNRCIEISKLAITADPTNPFNYFYLGEANRVKGLQFPIPSLRKRCFESAIQAYRDGLKWFPEDEHILLRLAQSLDGTRKYSEADDAYQAAIRNDPNLGVLYSFYGAHFRVMGQTTAAERCYATAKALSDHDISHVGMVEAQSLMGAEPFQTGTSAATPAPQSATPEVAAAPPSAPAESSTPSPTAVTPSGDVEPTATAAEPTQTAPVANDAPPVSPQAAKEIR